MFKRMSYLGLFANRKKIICHCFAHCPEADAVGMIVVAVEIIYFLSIVQSGHLYQVIAVVQGIPALPESGQREEVFYESLRHIACRTKWILEVEAPQKRSDGNWRRLADDPCRATCPDELDSIGNGKIGMIIF